MVMKTRIIKVIAFVLLGVSQIPGIYTLVLSIYNASAGIQASDADTIYGFRAFLGTWLAALANYLFIYIVALVITVISIITAIIAINADKKQREKNYAAEK